MSNMNEAMNFAAIGGGGGAGDDPEAMKFYV